MYPVNDTELSLQKIIGNNGEEVENQLYQKQSAPEVVNSLYRNQTTEVENSMYSALGTNNEVVNTAYKPN